MEGVKIRYIFNSLTWKDMEGGIQHGECNVRDYGEYEDVEIGFAEKAYGN